MTTEPLTPPDCDLRGMPFMPMDIVRVFDSDLYALSTGEEFKAAFTLWGKSFLQVPAASIPSDDRILAHLSGAGSRWAKVKAMALRGWILCGDGRLYHPVVAEKALEAWASRQAQRARTEAARAARAAQRQASDKPPTNITTDHVADTVTENATDTATDTATVSVTDNVTGSKGQGQGQGIKEESSLRSVASQAPPTPRGSRLPKDWQPQTAEREMARSMGLDCDAVLARFRDFWIAKPGKDGVKLDWDATFRNWLRNEGPRGRSAPPMKPKSATAQWADLMRGDAPAFDLDGSAEEIPH